MLPHLHAHHRQNTFPALLLFTAPRVRAKVVEGGRGARFAAGIPAETTAKDETQHHSRAKVSSTPSQGKTPVGAIAGRHCP